MSENWDSYLCHVKDKVASMFVDLGLHEQAPDSTRPHLLFVFVYFRMPRPDGLSSQEEFSVLCSIEDAIVPAMERECGAVMVGRITTDGRREFYFYGSSPANFEKAVKWVIPDFKEYRFRYGHQEDPVWNQYLHLLYPTRMQMQTIQNRKVLEVLQSHGDSLEAERDVQHWAYFKSVGDRDGFAKDVQALGYSLEPELHSSSDDKYGICFKRKQAVTEDEIDAAVIELNQVAARHNGDYDGWECQVMIDQSGPVN